ncbi:MAG: hypothetical protein B6V02_02000 [Thermoprotei archaeon ex4572_64]|nr:MAG: hypothetical protein B6V02_02000 [Thermoprotei archaeon ex4572_64]
MADVSFSVDIIMDLVQKSAGVQSQISNITQPVEKSISKLTSMFKQLPQKVPKDIVSQALNLQAAFKDVDAFVAHLKNQLVGAGYSIKDINKELAKVDLKQVGTGIIDKQISDITEKQQKLMETGKMNNQLMQTYGKHSKEASDYVAKMQQRWKLTGKEIAIATKNTKQMSFDFLTLLFGGMALQRTFGGMYRSMEEGYKSVSDDNDSYIKGLSKLSNAFTYVKFSMFDTFANVLVDTGALDKITDWLTDFGDLVNDYPEIGVVTLSLAGFFAVVGTAAIAGGQILQYRMMFDVIKGFSLLKTGKLDKATKSIDFLQSKLAKGIGVTGGILVTGFAVKELVKSIKEQNITGMIGNSIAAVLGAAGAITSFFNPAIGISLVILGAITQRFTDYIVELENKEKLVRGVNESIDRYLGTIGIDATPDITLSPETIKLQESGVTQQVSDEFNNLNLTISPDFEVSTENIKIESVTDKIIKDILSSEDKVESLKKELETLGSSEADQTRYSDILAEVRSIEQTIKTAEGAGKRYDLFFMTALRDAKELDKHLANIASSQVTLGNDLSNADILLGAEIFKDINVEDFTKSLEEIKTPLKEFINSFSGEDGLIVSLTGLISQTQAYVTYLPTLKDAMTSEGNKVDSLTNKYNALARAKKKAREGVYDTTGTSTRDEEKSYTVYGDN